MSLQISQSVDQLAGGAATDFRSTVSGQLSGPQLRQALRLRPDFVPAHSALLMALHYDTTHDRATIFQELQAYLWQNLVHIPLYNSDFTVAHLNTLSGLTILPNFMTDFRKTSLT